MTETQKQLWRAAGELYGLLEADLPGGNLRMLWDQDVQAVVYQWRFQIETETRAGDYAVSQHEFACIRNLHKLAESIVSKWGAN